MKKLLPATLLALSATGAAQTVDCSTVQVSSFGLLQYKIPGTFPTPPKDVYKSLEVEPVNFNECGYTVTSDTKKIVIKAGSLTELYKLLGMNEMKDPRFAVAFVGFSGYKYPTLREGFYSYSVWFTYNPLTGEIGTFDQSAESRATIATMKSATAGYKVNGGPITPFYYDGVVTKAKLPVDTKTIDLYAIRGSYNNGFDRILFDLENATVTLWTKHEFPKS
jgi:hypothetical protein